MVRNKYTSKMGSSKPTPNWSKLIYLWLLGFEPRSPRPQRGILTTKLQPLLLHGNSINNENESLNISFTPKSTIGKSQNIIIRTMPLFIYNACKNKKKNSQDDSTSSAHASGDSLRSAAADVSIPFSSIRQISFIAGLLDGSDWMQRLTALHTTRRSSCLKYLSSGSTK